MPSSPEEAVASLASTLRKMGRKVGVEESVDAVNALRLIGDPELFSAAIKSTLVKDYDPGGYLASERRRSETDIHFGSLGRRRVIGGLSPQVNDPNQEDSVEPSRHFEFGVYSPHGTQANPPGPRISRAEEKIWLVGMARFKNSVLTLEGHRFGRNPKGEINQRKTIQLELRKAGDSMEVFRSKKKVSKANVILLCDVSGSMRDSDSTIVNLSCSLKRVIPKSEVFLFSTKLERVTGLASRYSPRELALRIPKLDLGFGGGTKIGHCLRQFRIRYGALLTRKTTVLIFSDGWDVGEILTLRYEMRELRRRTNGVVWVNPFLDSKDYSAETLGMKTALEYVNLFLSPDGLLRVA